MGRKKKEKTHRLLINSYSKNKGSSANKLQKEKGVIHKQLQKKK